MLRRRCKVRTRPLAGKPDMDATHAYARRCCGNSAHCNARAASEDARGRGYSRGLWIAIHKHMIEQGRHGQPRASLDRPWPRRDTRTPTLCRHRRSPVDAADRRRQLRASNLPQPDSRRARLDKRRSQACQPHALMTLTQREHAWSAFRAARAGLGEVRGRRRACLTRWSPAYPFSAAPSAGQSSVASFEVDAPARCGPAARQKPVWQTAARLGRAGQAPGRKARRSGSNARRRTRPSARPPRLKRSSRQSRLAHLQTCR